MLNIGAFIAAVPHLCVAAEMPGCRSYVYAKGPLTAQQDNRRQRDLYYCSAHSRVGTKFTEVDEKLAHDIKKMAKAKTFQGTRDGQNGITSHYARNVCLLSVQ